MNNFVTTCCGAVYRDERDTKNWTGSCPNEECPRNYTGFKQI